MHWPGLGALWLSSSSLVLTSTSYPPAQKDKGKKTQSPHDAATNCRTPARARAAAYSSSFFYEFPPAPSARRGRSVGPAPPTTLVLRPGVSFQGPTCLWFDVEASVWPQRCCWALRGCGRQWSTTAREEWGRIQLAGSLCLAHSLSLVALSP